MGRVMRAASLLQRLPHSTEPSLAAARAGTDASDAAAAARPSYTATAATALQRRLAVDRVREAGGPLDHASYSCECGYVFLAPVSTTVACPHCGTGRPGRGAVDTA